MPHQSPSLNRSGYVARIKLERPERHNRLQPGDIARLRSMLAELATDDSVRVLVFGSSGESFSSGFDLSSSGADTEAGDEPGEVLLQHLCDELEDFPRPTVCAINGPVHGGASDLALACDFRIGVKAAKLRMPAAQLGICFYPTGLRRYVSRLGLSTSKRLFLSGELIDAEEMLRVGFLDALVADVPALEEATDSLVARLIKAAPAASAYTKQALNRTSYGLVDIAEGEAAFRRSLSSDEFANSLQAWTQRKSTNEVAR